MRVAFLGTPAAAVPSLDALTAAGHAIPIVITQPDRPAGRHRAPQPPPVKARALSLGIEVAQPARARDGALRDAISAAAPDVLVVVAYGKILPPDVLAAAPMGAVNVHFSLLPAYRGAAPVQWALARGETRTGVTTMRIEEGLDTGATYLSRAVEIEVGERAPALQGRLARIGAELLIETLDGLSRGAIAPRAQDHSVATEAPRLRREDGSYLPSWTAREIEGRMRGFDPWPGVWARRGVIRLRLVEGSVATGLSSGELPGRILAFQDGAFRMACASGTVLALHAVQPEGRRALRAGEARNGRQLAEGDLLETPSARS